MTKFLKNVDVTGYVSQTSVTSSLVKTDTNGKLVAAVAGTDYNAPNVTSVAGTLIREIRNTTGATLIKGTIVYISGATGNKPTVSKALATGDSTSAQTFGLCQTDISNNSNGNVVVIGDITGLDTSAFTEGVQLYLSSTTAGTYTTTKQLAPAHLVYVGVVTRSHPTQGQIEVKIQNGYELDEIHDVSISSLANNHTLVWESATSLWKNKTIAAALGYTPADDSAVVKLTGDQTVGGVKTFTASLLANNPSEGATGEGLIAGQSFKIDGTGTGQRAIMYVVSRTLSDTYASGLTAQYSNFAGDKSFGFNLNTAGGFELYVKNTTFFKALSIANTMAATFGNSVTATSFIKSGGTSAQFLKADGSVDSTSYMPAITFVSPLFIASGGDVNISKASASNNGYLSSTDWNTFNDKLSTSAAASTYLPLSGGTLTGALSGTTASFSGQVTSTTNFYTASISDTLGVRAFGGNSFSIRNNIAEDFNIDIYNRTSSVWYNALKLANNGGAATFSSSVTATGVTAKSAGNYGGFIADNSSSATIGGGYFAAYSFGVQRAIFGVAGSISGATDNNAGIFAEGGLGIKFFVNGSGTASHMMTSAGNLGIGTTSPAKKLHVYTADNEGIFLQGTGGGVWMNIQSSAGNLWSIGAQNDGMGVYNRTSSLYAFFIKDNRQLQLAGYTASSSYTGTAAGYLAFDSSGNVITVAGVAATDNTKLPLTGGALTGPLTITGNGSYLGDWGYKTLELNDTSGYAGIFFKSGANIWINRRNGADNAMDWAYSTNATAPGTGTFTQKMRLATDEWWVSTYTGYKVQILSGDQINVLNGTSATTLYLQYQLGNGGPVNIAAGKYTFSAAGLAVFNGTGIANSPNLRINTSSNTSFVHTQENFAANLTAGNRAMIFFGKEGSTKNAGGIGYYWAGAGSNSNFITMGHWGNDDLFRIYGDGTVTVGTNAVIHAGNIGSQSVSYATTAGSTNQIDGWDFTNTGSNFGTNANSIATNGISYVNTNANLLGQTDGALYSQAYNSDWQHQIYGDYRTGQLVVRGKNSGSWTGWRTIIDSSTIGSQSVANATTAGNATTAYGWANTPDSWYGVGQTTSASGATAVGGYYPWALSYHTGLALSAHSAYGGIRFYNQNYPTGPLAYAPAMQIINNGVLINGYTAIHAGNIGSQSVSSATTVTHYSGRTDPESYNVVWAAGNPSHMYSCDAVTIQSSTGTLYAKNFEASKYDYGFLYARITQSLALYSGTFGIEVFKNDQQYNYISENNFGSRSWDNYYMATFNPYGFSASYGNYYSGGSYGGVNLNSDAVNAYLNNGSWLHSTYQITSFNPSGYNFNFDGYSGGTLSIGGTLIQNTASDAKLKDNVVVISNALDKIKAIRGVEFDWNELAFEHAAKVGHEVGVIAQEVQAVYPFAVREHNREAEDRVYSHLVVDYEKLSPLAIQAINELADLLDEAKSDIQLLNSEIETLKTQVNGSNI